MKLEFYFPILIGCTYQESSDTLSEEVNVIENTQSDIYNKYADTLINIHYNNKEFIELKMLIDEHKENVEEFFKSINQRFKGNKLENDVEISEKGLILIYRNFICNRLETRSNYRLFLHLFKTIIEISIKKVEKQFLKLIKINEKVDMKVFLNNVIVKIMEHERILPYLLDLKNLFQDLTIINMFNECDEDLVFVYDLIRHSFENKVEEHQDVVSHNNIKRSIISKYSEINPDIAVALANLIYDSFIAFKNVLLCYESYDERQKIIMKRCIEADKLLTSYKLLKNVTKDEEKKFITFTEGLKALFEKKEVDFLFRNYSLEENN